jgi:hypothetical protein
MCHIAPATSSHAAPREGGKNGTTRTVIVVTASQLVSHNDHAKL